MISRYSTLAASAAVLAAAALATPSLSAGQKRTAQPAAAAPAHTPSVSGTVKTFAPGRELVVATSAGPKTYNLGAAHAEISADLAVGDRVNVEQKTGADGRPILKVSKQSAGH